MGTLRQELYHQSYQKVGVAFCSLPNFQEFYTELDGSNQGVECLRLLNEIIADFDELMCDERFHSIDKIKTIGSTYMIAVGLIPEYKIIPSDPHSTRRLMTSLIEFVRAMRIKLKNINDNSYNNFMLRVGVNVGSVVAGVIGARKPQYDIWGNTVNVASRMDSTGVPGYTQVTQDVVDALQGSHFEFKCRGQIKVKGKGDMVTYFLNDTKPSNELGMDHMRHYHENANYQGSAINKEIYMKKKNFGNYLEDKPTSSNLYNGMNLTENLNYVKREYDNYNKININNHYNINNYNINGQQQYSTQPHVQQYNIRENFNIIENPNDKPRGNYLDEPSNYSNHYNIVSARNEHEQEPLLNANVMPKVLYRAEQTNKYEPPQYVGVPFQRTIQPMSSESRYRHFQQAQPHQQQQQFMKKQTNSAPLRYHTSGNNNNNMVEAYMKPLPKLPVTNEFNESREMSSTDDLSHSDHRNSISVDSSSDESYSKTTDDCDQSNHKLDLQKVDQKHSNFHHRLGMIGDEQHKAIQALKDLQDYEISSTTDHTISTIPNKGESCNSFEFQDKRKFFV
jgi:class 3 adenylate cyclase